MAMLRALGIPARNNSGWMTAYTGEFRTGSARTKNFYQHVWTEFYLPNYGWIQADTSASIKNFAEITNDPRIITAKGDDFSLGHGFPLDSIPCFHLPQVNVLINSGTPRTQTWGEDFRLEVVKLVSSNQ